MASDGVPVLDDDALEAAPPGPDDGHTADDVAASGHGYGSRAEDEDDDPDAAADGGDTLQRRLRAPAGRICGGEQRAWSVRNDRVHQHGPVGVCLFLRMTCLTLLRVDGALCAGLDKDQKKVWLGR